MKRLFLLSLLLMAMTAWGQSNPQAPVEDSLVVASTEHPSQTDLTYEVIISNKTNSTYRVTLCGNYLGKIAPKKKQSFKARADWKGDLVAVQLDHYDIIPSKIVWTVPQQTPGTTVTFIISNK